MAHQAIEIYTGAILPKGVDTVVMFENCKEQMIKLLLKKNKEIPKC